MRKQSTRAIAARVIERALGTQQMHGRLRAVHARRSRKRKRVRKRSIRAAAARIVGRALVRSRRITASKLLTCIAAGSANTCDSGARELPLLESVVVQCAVDTQQAHCRLTAAHARRSREGKQVRKQSTRAVAARVIERAFGTQQEPSRFKAAPTYEGRSRQLPLLVS